MKMSFVKANLMEDQMAKVQPITECWLTSSLLQGDTSSLQRKNNSVTLKSNSGFLLPLENVMAWIFDIIDANVVLYMLLAYTKSACLLAKLTVQLQS